jgi:tRNA-2-methylthio-N6-dimethylallyladenosine synthase
VHFAPQAAATGAVDGTVRPGDVVTVAVTRAAPHHLVADDGVLTHRRTRAGDHSAEGTALTTPGVGLGMPSVGRPARPADPVPACG